LEPHPIGISPNIADTIFQPFITTKPKGKGRGLGLFIVDQFLAAEDCSIFLRSDLNDIGNRYVFQIDFNSISHE
jgi:C4-dicarboxylate-specific signal transduction histidine kinase